MTSPLPSPDPSAQPTAQPTAFPVPPIGFLRHRVGDRIKDRYDVLERLGGGNFGSVYKVRDSVVGNVLACKEMHVLDNPNTPTNERALALDLFRREALNLATLRHPNIPAAYFDTEEGEWRVCPVCGLDFLDTNLCPDHGAELLAVQTRYYLMMDFVDGASLEELADRETRERGRPLEEGRAIEWIHQIATAVRTLHRIGIIHRDIKPDNIKIRSSDEAAVLLDFGLTKKVEEAGGYGTAPLTGTARFGTAGYAPENPQERERPEQRSDIHALGMTLYRLVSGRDPQEMEQLREMREFSPRYFNRDLSPEIERVILVASAPELSQRFQSIDDFLAELESVRGDDVAASPLPAFTFADGAKARGATELARLLDSHHDEALSYLFNGMFASWLLQNGFAAPARVAETVAKTHAAMPDRALELFRRALYPTGTSHVLPRLEVDPPAINFGSVASGEGTTRTLRLHNSGPGLLWGDISVPPRRAPGQTALSTAVNTILAGDAGEEETSLPGLTLPDVWEGNEVEIELRLDTSRVAVGSYSSHLLLQTESAVLRVPVSYTVVPLDLKAEPDVLDFGALQVGKRAQKELKIVPSSGGGTPRGTIYVGPSLVGCDAPERFSGTEPLTVSVDAADPGVVAQLYEGLLQVDTNGGRLRVPVRYRVTLPPATLVSVVGQSILFGALGMALLRFLYTFVNPEFASRWLVTPGAGGPSLTGFEFKGLGPLIAGAGLGAYATWFYSERLKKIPRRQRPGMWKGTDDGVISTLPMLGLVVGAFAGYLGAQLLHWTLWSVGDWLFFPLIRVLPDGAQSLARGSAPFVWGAVGAFGGLLWGATRVLSATGRGPGRVIFVVLMAALFFLLLLGASVVTG